MSDRLFLNLWFPTFNEDEMMLRMASVARQFPFSQQRPGISYMAIYPVSFAEPLIFQQMFDVGADVERVIHLAGEFVHADFAYEFEINWDLWVAEQEGEMDTMWRLAPQQVRMLVHGVDFEDHLFREAGHIQFELGLDHLFLFEELEFDPDSEQRIKANVQKLVDFTQAIEKNCGISGRVLWSESDDAANLAQKLIARLQRVQ